MKKKPPPLPPHAEISEYNPQFLPGEETVPFSPENDLGLTAAS